MTTFFKVKKKCALCGAESTFEVIGSTNSFGSPDLDLRPPEMMRSTIDHAVEVCPECGYTARDVEEETKVKPEMMKVPAWKTFDGIPFKDELSKNFYHAYLLAAAVDDTETAFTMLRNAAWVSDDEKNAEAALACRKKAIPFLNQMIEKEEEREKRLTLEVVRADLLRRAEMFEEVEKLYANWSTGDKLLNQIIKFQRRMAKMKNTECFTVQDAL